MRGRRIPGSKELQGQVGEERSENTNFSYLNRECLLPEDINFIELVCLFVCLFFHKHRFQSGPEKPQVSVAKIKL